MKTNNTVSPNTKIGNNVRYILDKYDYKNSLVKPIAKIPQDAITEYNRGCAALSAEKYEKAVKLFKSSLAIGETTDCWLNLGTAYKALDLDTLSIDAFTKATSPDIYCMETCVSVSAMAYNNLGLMAYVRGDDITAQEYYLKAISAWNSSPLYKPGEEFFDCLWNQATCTLRQVFSGNYSNWTLGWDRYESRFKKRSAVKVNPVFRSIAHRVWGGQKNCRIVLAQEQGIGDNIMFARFIPQLEELYNVKCDLQIDAKLGAVLNLNGISCPTEIDVRNYDYVLPLGSICRFVSYIDSSPYITKLSDKVSIPGIEGKLNIGLVWSGSSSHANDRHRSCPVGNFSFLRGLGNIYSLNPAAERVPKWMHKVGGGTWMETCSVLSQMDIVITVDTSLAHMAGAMGVTTFMLQPRKETDFRWGYGSKETLWYSSMTVIPNNNSWPDCIAELRKEMIK